MRKTADFVFFVITAACALAVLTVPGGLVFAIARRGLPAMSISFFTEQIRLVGAQGGVLWNLVGTVILLVTAFRACAPFAVALALIERTWLRSSRAKRSLRLGLYTMNGLPSIVFGIFGFMVFVQWCGRGKSWLAGGIVLALMMLPTVTTVLIERIAAVPASYMEAAAGLGLRESQIVWAVLMRQSWGAVITGSLLGLARAAGETAPIMFTATIFAGATFPKAITESPVLTLPYHIFIPAQDSFDPAIDSKLWGSAPVLLELVFSLSLAALPSRLRIHEEANG
jgi:phosphate transport system permease protein